jgi:hypothetical protein
VKKPYRQAYSHLGMVTLRPLLRFSASQSVYLLRILLSSASVLCSRFRRFPTDVVSENNFLALIFYLM